MTATSSSQASIDNIFAGFAGANDARNLAIASLTVMCYDYFLTLDQEVKYFWRGQWTTTRVLYFLNRYFPPLAVSVAFLGLFGLGLPMPTCNAELQTNFILSLVGMVIVQAAALVTRIYYLYTFSRVVQYTVLLLFMGAVVATARLASLSFAFMEAETLPPSITIPFGCPLPPPIGLWTVLLPTFILHSILFALTIGRAFYRRRRGSKDHLMLRLLRDGGIFYFVVFVSVGLTVVGSMINGSYPVIFSAVYSDYILAMTSIAMCRLMLSIRSLAEGHAVDPAWLLSDTEMTRVAQRSRKGATSAEILVSVSTSPDSDSVAPTTAHGEGEPSTSPVAGPSGSSGSDATDQIRSTRVGTVERVIVESREIHLQEALRERSGDPGPSTVAGIVARDTV